MTHLIDATHMEAIDLLKCDIEGSERELFANCDISAHETLQSPL